MKKYFVLVLAILASGCAITAMDAKINPDPQVASSNIGGGVAVGVTVVDERPSKDLGRRAAGGGAIRLDADLAATYQAAIIKGLGAKGFSPVAGHIDGANLKVEIRSLSQDPSAGLWTVGADIDSSIKAYANNPNAKPYEHLYRSNSSNRTMFVSGAKSTNDKLNDATNTTIFNMFDDQKLLETLAAQ